MQSTKPSTNSHCKARLRLALLVGWGIHWKGLLRSRFRKLHFVLSFLPLVRINSALAEASSLEWCVHTAGLN